jgi:hypothetical protein
MRKGKEVYGGRRDEEVRMLERATKIMDGAKVDIIDGCWVLLAP